ncbi:unnamed protein product [Closterium sp. NIES-54]
MLTPGVPTTAVPATVTPSTSAKPPSISTHVLDVALGRPAAGIKVLLERQIEAGGLAEREGGDRGGRVTWLWADPLPASQRHSCTRYNPTRYSRTRYKRQASIYLHARAGRGSGQTRCWHPSAAGATDRSPRGE